MRLEKAIRRLADGIAAEERRAHIVLSGRITDWEFRRDLACLKEGLAVPSDLILPPPPTANEALISNIRRERREEQSPTVEQPLVLLMVSLDPERVRVFAAAKGAPNLDAFLAEIEAANLWRFARRPLDLDWLVQFWRSHGRLGTLKEMLESSLSERLNETNLDRARRDKLDDVRALQAVERIGAALVFGRKATIAIPDMEVSLSTDTRPLDLADVLPDWSADDRALLLTRPIFDPATLGRARLHNDNEGVVRGYLTASWLRRLREANLPREELSDLLSAQTYGVELIKPSMSEAAAWLSIWDDDVAREVTRRDPLLLLTAGDPGSLSAGQRRSSLTRLIEQIAQGNKQLPLLEADSIRRFCRPDIANVVRGLWPKHQGHSEARILLLRLIWLGDLKECADLAAEAAFRHEPDPDTRIVAGRAVLTTGDDATKRRYAELIKAECELLPTILVWEAIDGLFPIFLTVEDLLGILKVVDVAGSDGGLGFRWESPNLVNRLNSRTELERLLSGLLELLGGEIGDVSMGYPLDRREQAYFPAIAAAATRLLERCPADEVPDLAIDAALRLGMHRRDNSAVGKMPDVYGELHRTAARRRVAFWGASKRLSGHGMVGDRTIGSVNYMDVLGYRTGLRVEDVDWLLADGPRQGAENERRLAIDAAMAIWRGAGSPAGLLEKIEKTARADAVMTGAFEGCVHPKLPSAELIESAHQLEEMRRRSALAQEARDRSWVEFVAQLKANPNQLRQIIPSGPDFVDERLYRLWVLLSRTIGRDARYAIDSVAPLEPMLGPELTESLRDGLIVHWRGGGHCLRAPESPRRARDFLSGLLNLVDELSRLSFATRWDHYGRRAESVRN